MRGLHKLTMKLQMLFRRNHEGTRLDDELQFHLDQQIAENIAAGMNEREARHAAMRSFGNPTALRDQTREAWSWNWLESLLRDARIAARGLLRTPGFAVITVLVMALGIGANVALFTVVRSVLLKPLPFTDPDQLLRLYEHSADGKFPMNANAGGIYAEWKKQNQTLYDLALSGDTEYNLSAAGAQLPEKVSAAKFSWNVLQVLGVHPALGRNFTAADDRPSANATVILSWGLWKRRFGGNPAILNQTILLDANPYTVIGIMPAWFSYPRPSVQLWTPLYHEEMAHTMEALDNHMFQAIGRLKPGVTASQAVTDLSLITRRIHDQHLDDPFVSDAANARPLLESIVGDIKTPLYVLLAATGCVLLIACLNVANLLVARSAARRRELAIRTALGGSRLRLLREHLMESLLLAGAGGVAGFLAACWVIRWLAGGALQDLARVNAIHVDVSVMLFTFGLVLFCAIFAGLISALSVQDEQMLASLQEASRSHSAGHARASLRKTLLALEVGLTVVLLVGAGLLLKSYSRLRASNLGCITQNVLTMDFSLPQARYTQAAQRAQFFKTLLERVRNIPGVQAAGYISVVPGTGYGGDNSFVVVEQPPLPIGKSQYAMHRWADPGYFAAMGIPLLKGRTFDENQQLGHATEIVISDSFARRYFHDENPIGKHIKTFGKTLEIIGVVGDTLFSVGEPAQPQMYFNMLTDEYTFGSALMVRSRGGDVAQFGLPIQRVVQQMDHDLPVADILTMDQLMGKMTLDASFDATLLFVFAVLSLALAAIGLFGVLSYIVAQRTTEIGIRLALGAQREQVMRLMLRDGLRPAAVGLLLGLLASAGVTRMIESMLYGTSPFDPWVFVLVVVVLLFVAAAACTLPAWRASRLDPMQALRTE